MHYLRKNVFICLTVLVLVPLAHLPVIATGTDYQSTKDMTTFKDCAPQPGVVIQDSCRNGSDLIDKMTVAASNLNNYRADYKMVVHKGTELIQETGIIYFRKPKLFRVEVKEGPKKGALAVLCSDGKVHGHLGGMMKYFQAAVSPDSPLVRAINDYPMTGSDFYSLADFLKNMLKHHDLSLCTINPIQAGKVTCPVYILDIYSTGPKITEKAPLLLLKRIYVDPKTYLPQYWEDYTDGKLWSESSWKHLESNLVFSDNLFKL